MHGLRRFGVLILFSAVAYSNYGAEDDEHPKIKTSSTEFDSAYSSAVRDLENRHFAEGLESFSFGSVTSTDIESLAAEIRKERPVDTALGDPRVTYDVILQPGHYGRTTGALGTSGRRVSERALVAYITARVANELSARKVSVLVIKADQYSRNLKGTIFLAIHADGSVNPCSTGPSLAYSARSSTYAMHAIGWALGAALGYTYEDFKRDNYTAAERDYYMFSQVAAPKLKGLLEVGELTCPKAENKMIGASGAIAANIALALSFIKQVDLPGASD